MELAIDGLKVRFPYRRIYPEQYHFMCELKKLLDADQSRGLIEMPACAGRNIALLSLLTAYQKAHGGGALGKVIIATRTTSAMEKILEELELVLEKSQVDAHKMLTATGLPSHRMLEEAKRRAAARDRDEMDTTDEPNLSVDPLRPGVNRLADVVEAAVSRGWGAALLSTHLARLADVIVCRYHHMLHPSIAPLFVRSARPRESIVILDEAHNIDHVCVEAYSLFVRQPTLANSERVLERLRAYVLQRQAETPALLERECEQLASTPIASLLEHGASAGQPTTTSTATNASEGDGGSGAWGSWEVVERFGTPPTLSMMPPLDAVMGGTATSRGGGAGDGGGADDAGAADASCVPGGMRRALSFLWYLQRLVHYLGRRLASTSARAVFEQPRKFLYELDEVEPDFHRGLPFASARLRLLLGTLGLSDELQDFDSLILVTDLAALIAAHEASGGFSVCIAPHDEATPMRHEPILQLYCHDAAIAMAPLLASFRSLVLTASSLSPTMDVYMRILGMEGCAAVSLAASSSAPNAARAGSSSAAAAAAAAPRESFQPLVVSRGADQSQLRTPVDVMSCAPDVALNYGKLLYECASTIPDGVVVYFASSALMHFVLRAWEDAAAARGDAGEGGVLRQVARHKLVFVEMTDVNETAQALELYKRACDVGRGAVFLCAIRSRALEGVDFHGHYCRACLVLGFPFLDLRSRAVCARLEWLQATHHISEADFLSFDGGRAVSQCAGRTVRGKTDCSVLLLADQRWSKRRPMLPQWLQPSAGGARLPDNLSTDVAVRLARQQLSLAMARGAIRDGGATAVPNAN